MQRSILCDRVREQISLRLDGELSELESRMLASHVARCAECSAFEASVSDSTRRLRAAPLEPIPRPVVITRARRVSFARMQVGVAAVVAVAVLGAVMQIAPRGSESSFGKPARFDTTSQLTHEVKQIIENAETFSKQGTAFPL